MDPMREPLRAEVLMEAHALLDQGQSDEAARLVAAQPPPWANEVTLGSLGDFVERLPSEVADGHPLVRLHLIRAALDANDFNVARTTLESIDLKRLPPSLAAEVAVEWAILRGWTENLSDRLIKHSEQCLERLDPTQLMARIRIHATLGRHRARGEDAEAIADATRHLDTAIRECSRLGWDFALARTLMAKAVALSSPRGRWAEADALLTRAAEAAGRDVIRAKCLTMRAESLSRRGRFAEAEADLAQALALGLQLEEEIVVAYAWWERARIAAYRGDLVELRAAVASAEAQKGEWFEHFTGILFLADVGEWLDRLGDSAAGLARLREAEKRMEAVPARWPGVLLARAAVNIRNREWDGIEAEIGGWINKVAGPAQWCRAQLYMAVLAAAQGRPDASALAVQAFELAQSTGHPEVLAMTEAWAVGSVIDLAAEAGSLAVSHSEEVLRKRSLQCLGSCRFTIGGRETDLPGGKQGELIRFLAVQGATTHVEAVIDALWPESDLEHGLANLRAALSRGRRSLPPDMPDLIERVDGGLRLASDVEVDLERFESSARKVAERLAVGDASGALTPARLALARARGELVPEDRYASWAIGPRERVRRQLVTVLDLLADASAQDGDVDRAVALASQAMEAEPENEDRYLQAAEWLVQAGRSGPALAVLLRAEQCLAEIDVLPSHRLKALRAELSGVSRARHSL